MDFNPDGSIKLPGRITKQKEEDNITFESQPSFKTLREQTSKTTPLKCELIIEASKHINPEIIKAAFIEAENFKTDANLSIRKDNDKTVVRIVSGFNRCQWCHHFINHLSDRANARIIRTDRCNNRYKPDF